MKTSTIAPLLISAIPLVMGLLLQFLVYTPSHLKTTLGTHVLRDSSLPFFADKRNYINVIFVKFAWLWTSIVFLGFTAKTHGLAYTLHKSLIRWILATYYFLSWTQWFWGAPILDRIFTVTGGTCLLPPVEFSVNEVISITTSRECYERGGLWRNGIDISGHMYLLTHSCLFLFFELRLAFQKKQASIFTTPMVVMALLWWWMAVMTVLYFHDWPEKLGGWIFGLLYTIISYEWIYEHLRLL